LHFARQIKVIPIKISYNIRTKSEICKPGDLLIFVKDKHNSTGFECENYSNLSVENPFLAQLLNNCIFYAINYFVVTNTIHSKLSLNRIELLNQILEDNRM
jgi:hypothetical protein